MSQRAIGIPDWMVWITVFGGSIDAVERHTAADIAPARDRGRTVILGDDAERAFGAGRTGG